MSAILADVGPGDEVILPSFTFTTTATAFVLRGAVPVFVDIDRRSLNLDPAAVANAVTGRTRAIVPVHYAGIGCEMDSIQRIAKDIGAIVIEDAAQALLSTRDNRPLGSFGSMAALSFHQTKNVTAGEGGALLINDPALIDRAEVVREKGTNRARFHRGDVDKYSWVDIGSSYLPGELIAAFLLAQLEHAEELTERRKVNWGHYHASLEPLEEDGLLTRPQRLPGGNAHIYYVLLESPSGRANVIEFLRSRGISAVFHYVPLHSAPAGKRYGRIGGTLRVTDDVSQRLLRLPLSADLTVDEIDVVVETLGLAVRSIRRAV